MESRPQNPEFRNNPENFQPWNLQRCTSVFEDYFYLSKQCRLR